MAAIVAHPPPSQSYQEKTTHKPVNDTLTTIDTTIAHDGAILHYRLEGNLSASSPTLVFINEVLLNFYIWDPVIKLLKEQHPEWRFLRYDIRGYSSESLVSTEEVTLSSLANDLRALLAHLQISNILSIVGFGLGANIALTYLGLPDTEKSAHVGSFVGISFPLPGSPTQTEKWIKEKWDARIALATRWQMGITADKAVYRWLSVDARGNANWVRVRDMIAAGSIEGMGKVSNAIVESVTSDKASNGKKILKHLMVPSLFVTGGNDLVYPEEMEEYPSLMQEGMGKFELLARGGRLAFYERPGVFVDLLDSWLAK